MKTEEWNKIAAGVLIASITFLASDIIADKVFTPHHQEEERAYPIEGVGQPVAAAEESTPEGPEPVTPLLASASAEAGMGVAKKCAACHSFEAGGPHKVGPNLHNVVGAELGHKQDYAYSAAMAGHGGIWDYEALNAFLYKPSSYVPGTKMSFAGLKKAEDRAAVIVYLRSLTDNPPPLPNGE